MRTNGLVALGQRSRLTHLVIPTINFAVMHNARHCYNDVVGCDPLAEGAHEAARVHRSSWQRGGGVAARGARIAARESWSSRAPRNQDLSVCGLADGRGPF